MNARRSRSCSALIASGVVALLLSGCGLTIPTDPNGTLETVRDGELRVGVSPDPPLVVDSAGVPSGSVVALVDRFAAALDATPVWTVATEETLVGMLEEGDLDLIAGASRLTLRGWNVLASVAGSRISPAPMAVSS